jgi:hypothetical protein
MTSLQAHLSRTGASLRSLRNTECVREALAAMTNGRGVTLKLHSGERVCGVFCGFVDDRALLSTLGGGRRVPAREVEKILIELTPVAAEPVGRSALSARRSELVTGPQSDPRM